MEEKEARTMDMTNEEYTRLMEQMRELNLDTFEE